MCACTRRSRDFWQGRAEAAPQRWDCSFSTCGNIGCRASAPMLEQPAAYPQLSAPPTRRDEELRLWKERRDAAQQLPEPGWFSFGRSIPAAAAPERSGSSTARSSALVSSAPAAVGKAGACRCTPNFPVAKENVAPTGTCVNGRPRESTVLPLKERSPQDAIHRTCPTQHSKGKVTMRIGAVASAAQAVALGATHNIAKTVRHVSLDGTKTRLDSLQQLPCKYLSEILCDLHDDCREPYDVPTYGRAANALASDLQCVQFSDASRKYMDLSPRRLGEGFKGNSDKSYQPSPHGETNSCVVDIESQYSFDGASSLGTDIEAQYTFDMSSLEQVSSPRMYADAESAFDLSPSIRKEPSACIYRMLYTPTSNDPNCPVVNM